MGFIDGIGDLFNAAVDKNNHGVFSGKWDFQLGIDRVLGIIPTASAHIVSNNIVTLGTATGTAGTAILAPFNPLNNASGPLFLIGGILVIVIGGYVGYKVLKYL